MGSDGLAGYWARIAVLLPIWAVLATPLAAPPLPPLPGAGVALLQAKPVALVGADPVHDSSTLRFVGGWKLDSSDWRFGGISAIRVRAGRALAISDSGTMLRFDLPGSPEFGRVAITPLPQPGRSSWRKANRDTESLVLDGGRLWIGFEKRNAIWRYDAATLRPQAQVRPRAMRDWPSNSGAEAMARLPDGRFLVISEGPKSGEAPSEALLFSGDPARPGTQVRRLTYPRPAGYRVADAAALPDGRVLILHRHLGPTGLRGLLSIAQVPQGRVLRSEPIALLNPRFSLDNFEAMSVEVTPQGTRLWLATDDNFLGFQRTVLLQFALGSREKPASAGTKAGLPVRR